MSRTYRALYTPLSVATSIAGGMIAGSVFTQICKRRHRPRQRAGLPSGDP